MDYIISLQHLTETAFVVDGFVPDVFEKDLKKADEIYSFDTEDSFDKVHLSVDDTDLEDVQTALQSTDSKSPDILQWGVYSVEQTEFNVQTVLKDPDNFLKEFHSLLHKDERAFREKSNVQVQTSPNDVHTGSVQM